MANFLRGTTDFPFRSIVFSLTLPVEDWGFAHKNVRIMTDESSEWDDLPTKDNIVSHCVNVKCHSYSYPHILSVKSNEEVGSWCQTQRLLFPLL
jgi:hypothetical protein